MGGGAPEWPGERGESGYRIGDKYVELSTNMEPFFLFIIFIFVSTGKAGRAPQILRVRVSFPTYKPGRRTAYRGIGTVRTLT